MQCKNEFVLFGRMAGEAKTYQSPSGNMKAIFCIAIDNGKDANGEKRQPYFIDCETWGKKAEVISKYFHKGDQILAGGMIVTRMATNAEGKNVKYQSLCVDDISFISSGDRKEEPHQSEVDMAPVTDEELPF